jgi:hypothetical protein
MNHYLNKETLIYNTRLFVYQVHIIMLFLLQNEVVIPTVVLLEESWQVVLIRFFDLISLYKCIYVLRNSLHAFVNNKPISNCYKSRIYFDQNKMFINNVYTAKHHVLLYSEISLLWTVSGPFKSVQNIEVFTLERDVSNKDLSVGSETVHN